MTFMRLGYFVYRRRRAVFALGLIGVLVMGVIGFGVFPRLLGGGYDDAGSDSAKAAAILDQEFGSPDADLVIAVRLMQPVDESFMAGSELVTQVADIPGVLRVTDPWSAPSPVLMSDDGRAAAVLVTYEPDSARQPSEITSDIFDAVDRTTSGGALAGAEFDIGGQEAVFRSINDRVAEDLGKAESIAVPISLVIMLVVVGSLVAAGTPLLVAAGSILGSFFVLYVLSLFTDVSIFGLNLVTGLGLGLGIDYALLVVSRYREELQRQDDVGEAVAQTVASAGRTVFFSGLTVALTLAALLFFPQYFLRTFAYAGISVVVFAVIGGVIILPALLAMLGTRINALRIRPNAGRPASGHRWASLSRFIMRRPIPVALASIFLLGILAWPAMGVVFNQADERALPADDPAALAVSVIAQDFPQLDTAPIEVLVPISTPASVIGEYAAALSSVPTVELVSTSDGTFTNGQSSITQPSPMHYSSSKHARLVAFSETRPRGPEGEALITAIRSVPAPPGTLVGGIAASYADSQSGIANALPFAIGWVLVTVFVLVFLFTGSLLLPLKAVILNVLSLVAAIGVLVWIFQDGHFGWLVGDFVRTGAIDTSIVVLTAIVAFGLSMDYEVFLLSRIKEEYDKTGDNTEAVAFGLAKSAGIITAAALLLAVVFSAFITSSVTLIKILGVGVTVAVLLDATVVRVFLVPAFMRIAGSANWWAPRPLRAVYQRFGLHDS